MDGTTPAPAPLPAAAGDPAFGVYVHWPFCASKCPYCDFNSHVAEAVDHGRWRRALLAELASAAAETPGRTVGSVFFGGGTPSLMEPETVAAVIAAVRSLWPCAPDLEVTLEANPGSVEAARFAALRAAGVERVSIGVQALDDDALRFLGRRHSVAEARAAVAEAARHFPRYSFDLIYARPGQRATAWRAELADALGMAGGHLSLYQLTIEPGTAFKRDGVRATDEDTAARLFEITQEMAGARGLTAYEISNHARAGEECRHNLAAWRGGDYAGVGPGAHGRIGGPDGVAAVRRWRAPDRWLAAVEAHGHGTAEREVLRAAERREELAMLGLRLAEGVDRARFARLAGTPLEAVLDANAIRRLVAGGLLADDGVAVRLTPQGRLVLDSVLAALLA